MRGTDKMRCVSVDSNDYVCGICRCRRQALPLHVMKEFVEGSQTAGSAQSHHRLVPELALGGRCQTPGYVSDFLCHMAESH